MVQNNLGIKGLKRRFYVCNVSTILYRMVRISQFWYSGKLHWHAYEVLYSVTDKT
jgi:hypothetical protein